MSLQVSQPNACRPHPALHCTSPRQDRLGSGCTGVLLHMDLAAPPEGAEAGGRVAAVAAVGPCAAVLGQRQGGFASATAAPQLLAGGNAAR